MNLKSIILTLFLVCFILSWANAQKEKFINAQYENNAQIGIWEVQQGENKQTLDYNFEIQYSKFGCGSDLASITADDLFKDNTLIGYKAPIFTSGETYNEFIQRNIHFPPNAKKIGIEGKVVLTFILTKEGEIKNLALKQGVYPSMDKETVRVARLFKFSSPAILNGVPQEYCVVFTVKYIIP